MDHGWCAGQVRERDRKSNRVSHAKHQRHSVRHCVGQARTNAWTEFTPPTYPGQTRRPNVDYQNNIWWGIWAAGKRPGKLAKLDQTTGRITEYTIPEQNAQPYDRSE